MKFPRFLVLVIALLVPSSVGADTLSFIVTEGITNELSVSFGLVPFELSDGRLRESGLPHPFIFGGSMELVSGPLVNLDVDAVNGLTTYSYGAGLVQLTMTARQGRSEATGTFFALTEPFSIEVCEGCYRPPTSGFSDAPDFEIPFGAGLFDANLAQFLRIDPHTIGGFIDFGLEEINGGPLSDKRTGWDHRGFARMEIEAVAPEPALSLLMLLGGAGWLARRKFRRA